MEFIQEMIAIPLGYIMWACYNFFKDYGIAIMLFTLFTKVIMFPISLMIQKNSIKMVKMKPEIDALRYQYIDNKDEFMEAQAALYKREHYSSMTGIWPLLLQIPIILGLVEVVENPLKHILHLSKDVINTFTNSGELSQLEVVKMAKEGILSGDPDLVNKISGLNMKFLGIDLSVTPSITVLNIVFLVPIIAGITAFLLCYIQNKINVLQIEQNKANQWGLTIFMIAFSTFFAFIVPAGVGLYWAWGNLFGILVMYLVNAVYSPKKYINYKALEEMKKTVAEEKKIKKENKKIAKVYYKKFFEKENVENMKLMFYAEGAGYYKYFKNIIDSIMKESDIVIHYVTSDANDPILKTENKRIKPYYVDETRLITLMIKLDVDMVVMTTPDLEKYQIKRSRVRKDIEYVYVDHACSSLNLTYRTGAFDYFDTIFAVSRSQALEIRAIEKVRNTRKKKIVKCGYGLIDNMIASYEASEKKENEKKTILIGPSWQYDNILDSCLDDLVESLDGKGYKIVIRPHPQYTRRFPLKIKEMLEKYKDRLSDDFIIETDFSSNVTVYTADLLITDWSAISYEFSFATNKPTLFINTEMKVVNHDYKLVDIVPFDITARNEIGVSCEKDEVKNIHEKVAYLLENQNEFTEKIDSLKNEYFYNLSSSGEIGARYIIRRILKKGTADEEDKKEEISAQ